VSSRSRLSGWSPTITVPAGPPRVVSFCDSRAWVSVYSVQPDDRPDDAAPRDRGARHRDPRVLAPTKALVIPAPGVDPDANTAVHVADAEADAGKRAFTRAELVALFGHADEQVSRIRGAGRKGWLPAFRDAVLFKIAYAFGLWRNETRMLDTVDFGRNPSGGEFGEYGVLYVRHGKAKKGSPPKRRGVVTVWDWSAEVLQEWLEEVRRLFPTAASSACWPSEHGPRIGLSQISQGVVIGVADRPD
jgi:hypothetical protein